MTALLAPSRARHGTPGRIKRAARFALVQARTPGRTRRAWRFGRTCMHAAKSLPTVRRAVPWYVWPILAVAAVVKCFPLDFGTDETLFALAFALIAWRRPGLLRALYREAQAGKPAACACPQHARKAAGR